MLDIPLIYLTFVWKYLLHNYRLVKYIPSLYNVYKNVFSSIRRNIISNNFYCG